MRNKLNIIFSEFFHTFFFTYILLLFIEIFYEGVVSNFFNLNYLLGFTVMVGLVMIVTEDRSKKLYISFAGSGDFENVFLLSVLAGLIVYAKTHAFGPASIAVSIITVIVVLALSILTLKEASKDAIVKTMQVLKETLPIPGSILSFLIQLDAVDRLTLFTILRHVHGHSMGKRAKKTPPKL